MLERIAFVGNKQRSFDQGMITRLRESAHVDSFPYFPDAVKILPYRKYEVIAMHETIGAGKENIYVVRHMLKLQHYHFTELLVRSLRESPINKDTPLLILDTTNHQHPEAEEALMRAGATAYIDSNNVVVSSGIILEYITRTY